MVTQEDRSKMYKDRKISSVIKNEDMLFLCLKGYLL